MAINRLLASPIGSPVCGEWSLPSVCGLGQLHEPGEVPPPPGGPQHRPETARCGHWWRWHDSHQLLHINKFIHYTANIIFNGEFLCPYKHEFTILHCMKTLPLLIRNCTVHRYPALAAFISGVLPPSDSCSWKWYQYQWWCVHTWPDQQKIIIQKTFTSSAPCSSKASATSVWPFSQAYVRAVSPVPVVAWTLAPVNNPQTGQLTSLASLIIPPSYHQTSTLVLPALCVLWFINGLTCFQEVPHKVQMSLLCSLHQGCAAAQLDVGPGFNQEVCHFQESSTAGQGQSCLLGFFRLGIYVGTCRWYRVACDQYHLLPLAL